MRIAKKINCTNDLTKRSTIKIYNSVHKVQYSIKTNITKGLSQKIQQSDFC